MYVCSMYTVVKVDGATPKKWRLVRGHDVFQYMGGKRHWAIYFPGSITVILVIAFLAIAVCCIIVCMQLRPSRHITRFGARYAILELDKSLQTFCTRNDYGCLDCIMSVLDYTTFCFLFCFSRN